MIIKSKFIILIIFLFLANNIFSMDHGQIISDYLSNKITSQKLNEKILDNKWNFLAIVKYVPFQEVRKIYLKLYKEYSPEFRRLNSDAYICQEISSAYEELIKYKKNYEHMQDNVNHHQHLKRQYTKRKVSKIDHNIFIINVSLLCDILPIINEINRIKILGGIDDQKIKDAILFDRKVNIYSNIFNLVKTIFCIKQNKIISTENYYLNKAQFFSFFYIIYNLKFMKKDYEILKNIDNLIEYNKRETRNFTKVKFIQYVWLTVNKLAPYLGFIFSRKINENISILSALINSKNLKLKPIEIFRIIELLSQISEIMRKHYRYKVETGCYENYKANG